MTRVAAPPSFVLGPPDVLTARGMPRWKDLARGGGALKRSATIVWLTATIPAHWDRAAASLGMHAPGLLSTDPFPSPTQNAGIPPLVRKPPPPFPDKPIGSLSLRGSFPTSLPERNSTAASNYWPDPVLLMDVGEGHGKSQPLVKPHPHS